MFVKVTAIDNGADKKHYDLIINTDHITTICGDVVEIIDRKMGVRLTPESARRLEVLIEVVS